MERILGGCQRDRVCLCVIDACLREWLKAPFTKALR